MGMFDSVGNWLEKPEAPVLMGNVASAIMGPNQDSWQARLGQVGSQFGQSAIASDALKKQQEEQNQFRKMLMAYLSGQPGTGFPLSPADQPGDTDITMKINPDGTYSKTVKGLSTPTMGEGERMAVSPVTPSRQVATQPSPSGVPQSRTFDQSLIPLL